MGRRIPMKRGERGARRAARTPTPGTPRVLRRLRWPLAVAFLAVLAASFLAATLPDETIQDSVRQWIVGLAMLLGILALSAWVPQPPDRITRRSWM